jgi:maltose/moltooligosaccharide transporter
LPQIVANLTLGWFIKHLFNGQSVNVLVLGGVSMAIGGILMLIVSDAAKKEA